MLELIALGDDSQAAQEAAVAAGGVSYVADADDTREHPFRTLVRAVTDKPEQLAGAATKGLHVAFARVIRERPTASYAAQAAESSTANEAQAAASNTDDEAQAAASGAGTDSPGVTAIFPMVHRPDLTHAQGDAHWRDVHAPLALRHHPGMWDYTQLSIVATIAGEPYDGFALVAFASITDMRERFFGDDHDRAVILDDIAKFADPDRSPRRVVTSERIHATRPPTANFNWPQDQRT